jgi:hypothetical protein
MFDRGGGEIKSPKSDMGYMAVRQSVTPKGLGQSFVPLVVP